MTKTITPESARRLILRMERSVNVSASMKDICCFVTVKCVTISHGIQGRPQAEIEEKRGLRLQNTIYYLDGSMQLLHKEPEHLIMRAEAGIPDWSDERLTAIYEAFWKRKEETK